jgi:hypothetical protein
MKTRQLVAALSLVAAGGATAGLAMFQGADAAGNARAEHLVGINTLLSQDQPATGPVWAVGPISGTGTTHQLSDTTDEFDLPAGTFVVQHHEKTNHDVFDAKTCRGHLDEAGTWKILNGTGDYANAHGHGTYTTRGDIIGDPNNCAQNTPPLSVLVIIEADGTASM